MRLHIQDPGIPLSSELRGWLAERLDAMNTPAAEILEARVTCSAQMHIEFLLAGQTLCVVQASATLTEAAEAVLHAIGRQLWGVRLAQQDSHTRGIRRGLGDHFAQRCPSLDPRLPLSGGECS
jgi:hypothetical protein